MSASDEFSVERIAELARIDASDDYLKATKAELRSILNFVAIIDELELSDVQPFFGTDCLAIDPSEIPTRIDVVSTSIRRESIMKNAPQQDGEFYRVPPVFE